MERICENCKQPYFKRACDSKKAWARRKYCSIPCSGTTFKKGQKPPRRAETPKGPDNPNWRGGRYTGNNGYVMVRVGGKYKLEHRHVMEQHLGRTLTRREHVHHLNHDKQDNCLENLEVVDIAEHNRKHTTERWQADKPFRKGLKCQTTG